uniref:Uncharacterized protein n=1 Tax=Salmo trutta TaxID=8032 RepID=A0A674E3V0_SALTR
MASESGKEAPKEGDFGMPAVNPELFVRPVRPNSLATIVLRTMSLS